MYRAYNDWLAEFCATAPERLIGVGLMITAHRIEGGDLGLESDPCCKMVELDADTGKSNPQFLQKVEGQPRWVQTGTTT